MSVIRIRNFRNFLGKNFCPYCGERLKKQKIVNIVRKGDKDFQKIWYESRKWMSGNATLRFPLFVTKVKVITYIYICPNCDEEFTDDEVTDIRILQKKRKTKILWKDKPSDLE